jgi:hypothetical protein
MQKEHDENLKRWELESEHAQQRKDEEEKRHQELLKAIAGMGHVSTKDDEEAEKKKSKSLKEKLETLFKDIMKPIEAIGEFFKDVFKFVEKIFLNIGKGIIEIGKGLFGILEFFVGLGKDLAEVAGIVLMKVIKYIGPILSKIFKAIEIVFNKVFTSLAELATKALSGNGNNNAPTTTVPETPQQARDRRRKRNNLGRAASAVAFSESVIGLMQQLQGAKTQKDYSEIVKTMLAAPAVGAGVGFLVGKFTPLGATRGVVWGEAIAETLATIYELKKAAYDPAVAKEKQRKVLYYGQDAVDLMDEKGLDPSDKEVASLILDYQKETLIPLMKEKGYTIKIKPDGTYDYDWKNFIPTFENKEHKVVEQESLLQDFIEGLEKLHQMNYVNQIKEDLAKDLMKEVGFGLDFFGSVEKNMTTGAEQFIKDEMDSIKESLPVQGMSDKLNGTKFEFANMLKKVENIISDTDLHNGATIIMPTVTNTTEGPGLKRKEGDGIGLVRTTDTSLRQCQNNYAIAC